MSAVTVRAGLGLWLLGALCVLCSAAAQAADDPVPPAPPEARAALDKLNALMADVRSETDIQGYRSRYEKQYFFEAEDGVLYIKEDYTGESHDAQGLFMEWSGTYVHMVPAAEVKLELPAAEADFFRIKCQGKARCIAYKSLDEFTRSRGQSPQKPRDTGGLKASVNVSVGQDRQLMEEAFQLMAKALAELRKATPQ
jgi:hypothetical protein